MQRAKLRTIAAAAVALLAAANASAIEVGARLGGGNIQFPYSSKEPTTGDSFPSTNFWLGGETWFSAPLGENASFRLAYERDQVLRNCLLSSIGFEWGVAKISVGPMIGFLNSPAAPLSMGLSSTVKVQWPGVGYVSMRSDGGFAISILQSGADPQARTDLAAGIYVPHAIVTGLISAKRFNELDDAGDLVTDMSTRYALTIDVFKKNVPYTALASIGYEHRSKRYAGPDKIDTLGAVTLGLRSTGQLTQAMILEGDITSGIYVFGLDELKGRGPPNNSFLFSASVGLSVDLDCLPPKLERPADEPEAEATAEAVAAAEPTPAAPEGAATGEAAAASGPEAVPAEGPAADAAAAAPAAELPSAPKRKRFSFDVGLGLGYKISAIAGDSIVLGALSNAKLGLLTGMGYELLPGLSVGVEAGASYMASLASSDLAHLIDLPAHATLTWRLGVLRLQGFGGLLSSLTIGDATELSFAPEAGGRISVGGIFAESAFVIGLGGADSYPRVGLGYKFMF